MEETVALPRRSMNDPETLSVSVTSFRVAVTSPSAGEAFGGTTWVPDRNASKVIVAAVAEAIGSAEATSSKISRWYFLFTSRTP
jgi:hypothetical protein